MQVVEMSSTARSRVMFAALAILVLCMLCGCSFDAPRI